MGDSRQQDNYFQFQLDVLLKEIDLIDHTIARLDEILLRNRNWGITLWAGLVAIILQSEALENSLLLATAVIPLLFWLIDIRWKMALLRCSDRQKRVADFLNSQALQEAFESCQLLSIELLDPTGARLPSKEREYFMQAIRYKDTPIFYPSLVLGSVLLFALR